MTFTTWGQSATHSTTVLASPAPTTTSCTVAAIGTVRVGMSVFIDVSGTPEQTAITGISGANVTFSPALSGAPDVGGDFISYHQPLSNNKLNNGAVWKTTDIADLTATDTTNMNDGTLAYVPNYGVFRLDSGSTESANGSTVIDPTTGPGRWLLDVSSGGGEGSAEESVSDPIMDIQNIEQDIIEINENLDRKPDVYTFTEFRSGFSVGATSFDHEYFTISLDGVNFNTPDAVQVIPPPEQSDVALIFSPAYWRAQNTVVFKIYNPTAGAITLNGGQWTIIVWRDKNA
jgi:hypothetical protein